MKKQLISTERYEELVALGMLKAREVRDYLESVWLCEFCGDPLPKCECSDGKDFGFDRGLSQKDLNKVSTIMFILIGEVLSRHGPGLQKHDQGLRNAYERIAERAKALGAADHPDGAQPNEVEALEDPPRREDPVAEGGDVSSEGPMARENEGLP